MAAKMYRCVMSHQVRLGANPFHMVAQGEVAEAGSAVLRTDKPDPALWEPFVPDYAADVKPEPVREPQPEAKR
jgi:hypothetical protein